MVNHRLLRTQFGLLDRTIFIRILYELVLSIISYRQ